MRTEFREPMSENNENALAGEELMEFIADFNLPPMVHNGLVSLIDTYVEECETSAYAKGAIEKPVIKEYIDGALMATHNQPGGST